MRSCFSFLATAALLGHVLLAAACTDYNDPSSFNNPPSDGGSADGRPGDASGKSDSANLVGDASPGSFACQQTICPPGTYCVRILAADSGVAESAACYPLLQCKDCPCVTNVVATSVCQGDTLGCAGTPGADLYVTCTQGGAPPGDAGAGG